MGLLTDIFNQDAFNLFNMTEAVNKLPQLPQKLGDMGLFTKKYIPTLTASVEEQNGVLSLVQTQLRGARGPEMKHVKRALRAWPVPHLPLFDTVKADEIVGIREFAAPMDSDGSSDVSSAEQALRTISAILNNRQTIMKNSLDVTKEWHRVGAIQGNVLDADGSTVLFNWFNEFGLSQTVVNYDFGASPAVSVKVKSQQLCRSMIFALGNTPYTGIQMICGDNFWDAFMGAPSVTEAYKNYDNSFLKTQQRNGFMFADMFWMNYTGRVGSTDMIPTNTAIALPLGVPGLFSEVYAPANFVEAVNTPGKELYSKQKVLDYETGIEIHMQTNPLMIPNRPGCLFSVTKS